MAGNIVISGSVPSSTGKVVSVNEYLDFVSRSRKVVMQVEVDASGFFLIRLKNVKGPLINLGIGNLSLDIYVSDKNTYILGEENDKIVLKKESGIPTNKILTNLEKEVVNNWIPLFIDIKTQDFKRGISPDSILSQLNRLGRPYLNKPDSILQSLVYYKMAYYKLFYFDMSNYALGTELNKFEDEYFNSKKIQLSNPCYISALEYYLRVRMNSLQFSRLHKETDRVSAVVTEAEFFKDRVLRQLAMVLGIKLIFKFPIVSTEKKEMLENINNNVLSRDMEPDVREILKRVVLLNEKIKVGDIFPVMLLKGMDGLADSITNAKSDLILVDFWATWCFACLEGMRRFPDWLSQCDGKLAIVCISVDENFNKMKAFIDKKHFPPSVLALYNGEQGNYYNTVPIQQLPTYYLLNKKGEVLAIPPVADGIPSMLKKFM
jgi:thiol-disulfide isomerase/thioredoxin